MQLPVHRKDRIDRISSWVQQLDQRATKLFEHERQTQAALDSARSATGQASGRLRRVRLGRAVARGERRLAKLSVRRAELAEGEIRTIMRALQEQSHETRERLDRALERLAPVQDEWDRLRATFEALESAVETPALEQLTGQWRGVLEIPEFPVHERAGYTKPFPHSAVVF